jgi:hypothetical protein
MTPKQLHERIKAMWPGSAAAKPEWETQYHNVLRPYLPREIEVAWDRWHSDPPHDHPPKPHEIAKLVKSRRQMGGNTPKVSISTHEVEDLVNPIMDDRQLRDLTQVMESLHRNGETSGTALEAHTATKLISMGDCIIERHYAAVQASESV